METKRFSKALALDVLEKRAVRIAKENDFNRRNGTAQLEKRGATEAELRATNRAVEYGRMRAFEQFAEDICAGCRFEAQRGR